MSKEVELTLQERATSLTLQDRGDYDLAPSGFQASTFQNSAFQTELGGMAFTLKARVTSLALSARDLALTLKERITSLTLRG